MFLFKKLKYKITLSTHQKQDKKHTTKHMERTTYKQKTCTQIFTFKDTVYFWYWHVRGFALLVKTVARKR